MPSCAISLKATCWDMSVGVAYGGWTYVFLLNTPHLYSILQCVELDLVDSEAAPLCLAVLLIMHLLLPRYCKTLHIRRSVCLYKSQLKVHYYSRTCLSFCYYGTIYQYQGYWHTGPWYRLHSSASISTHSAFFTMLGILKKKKEMQVLVWMNFVSFSG